MKSKIWLTSTVLVVSFLSACGASRDGSGNGFFPTIDMSVPENAATTTTVVLGGHELVVNPLAQSFTAAAVTTLDSVTSSANIFAQWGYRMSLSLDRINSVLVRLNQTNKINSVGAFTAKVAGGTITGFVKDLNDTTYARQAVLCVDSAPYLQVKWSSDKTKVAVVRDFSKSPVSVIPTTNMKSEIIYSAAADGSKSVTALNNGVPYNTPADVKTAVGDPAYLGEAIEFGLSAAGVFTARGVNAWNASAYTANNSYTGDAYLTGRLAADGTGTYVATRVFTTGCDNKFPFDDAHPTGANGYCFTGTIAGDATTTHRAFSPTDWTSEMQTIGIESDTNIKFIDFEAGLSCTE